MTSSPQDSGKLPFDLARLEAFLKARLGYSGETVVSAVAGGQSNPTFFVEAGARHLVLRKRPPGDLLPSAHAIDREYAAQNALAGSGVPVASMVLYCDDETIIGTPFYLMERIEGRIFSDSALTKAPAAERRLMYRDTARVLAAIHDADIDVIGLGDFGRRGGYIERQIKRWSQQWRLSAEMENPAMERLVRWLGDNMPASETTRLTHGDFRIGNLIFHPIEPRVVAVLDWELSTLGDPLADLAHSCVYGWYVRPEEYGGLLGVDLAAGALPALEEFVGDYTAARGDGQKLETYHLVFALFRNAAIFEGIAARARLGNAASGDAARVGALAPLFLQRGLELAGI